MYKNTKSKTNYVLVSHEQTKTQAGEKNAFATFRIFFPFCIHKKVKMYIKYVYGKSSVGIDQGFHHQCIPTKSSSVGDFILFTEINQKDERHGQSCL